MKQQIVSFDQDEEGHWRVLLSCGHQRHVRHRPPLETRLWVLETREREERIGSEIDCRWCDGEEDE